jgi:hypothetical protein
MGPRLVPAVILAAIAAFALAAATAAAGTAAPRWWSAGLALAVLGGIVPMIQAVTIRVVPVFTRRSWPSQAWLRAQVALLIAGAWLVFAGRLLPAPAIALAGSVTALAGGLVVMANMVWLSRQPLAAVPAPPLPSPEQADADALAMRLTRWSGGYLVVGLLVGVMLEVWRPPVGRWELLWAHALLLGGFMMMATGICYHVLARWTGRPWRLPAAMRLHVDLATSSLPVMLVALALDRTPLFALGGALQAVALFLFLLAIAPMLPHLSGPTRTAFIGAAAMLAAGLALALLFALDPAAGARLRQVHAQLNLFGWGGLLVSGVGYYLFPRFAGEPLRWPRLARLQLALLAGGVALAAAGGAWRAVGGASGATVAAGMTLAAAGFAVYGAIVAGTFFNARRSGRGATSEVKLSKLPAARGAAGLLQAEPQAAGNASPLTMPWSSARGKS